MANKDQKIAIIGAGIAGLSAAYRLKQLGFSNVEVFEARERVGGRIYTVILEHKGKQYPVELGGWNLTDGGVKGYIYKLISELGLEIDARLSKITEKFHDGNSITDLSKLSDAYLETLGDVDLELFIKERAAKHETIDELLKDLFVDNDLLYRSCYVKYAAFEGGMPEDISAKHWSNLPYILRGGLASVHTQNEIELSSIKGGNALLTEKISQMLADSIYKNHVLKSLVQDQEEIRMEFSNGVVKTCDKIILATPLSVLSDINIDSQLIPLTQLNFLKNVKYGTNSKIIWNEILNQNKRILCDEFAVMQPKENEPITFYYVGKYGRDLGLSPSESFKRAICYMAIEKDPSEYSLVEVSGDQFSNYSDSIYHSWCDDKFSKGSYSFTNVEIFDEFNQLEQFGGRTLRKPFLPIDNKVYFAGEHTAVEADIGTIEGAAESGFRAAELVDL